MNWMLNRLARIVSASYFFHMPNNNNNYILLHIIITVIAMLIVIDIVLYGCDLTQNELIIVVIIAIP